jgi:anti-sigma regulatory factor (Ser/Thr protein kinase)
MEKFFKRDIKSLDGIFDFLDNWISLHDVGESPAFTIKFAVEEIFTNMVKYNPLSSEKIQIALNVKEHDIVVELTDFETVPFDITTKEDVDVTLPIEQRKPGGLGVHLVKIMVDKAEFDHAGNKSTITLTLKLER